MRSDFQDDEVDVQTKSWIGVDASDLRLLVRVLAIGLVAAPCARWFWPDLQTILTVGVMSSIGVFAMEVSMLPLKRMIRQHRKSWTLSSFPRGLSLIVLGILLQWLVSFAIASRIASEGIRQAVAELTAWDAPWLLGFLAGITVSVLGFASLLLRWDANALEKGTFDRPEDEAGTKHAIWQHSLSLAQRRARTLPETASAIGVLIREDKRTPIRKIQSKPIDTPGALKFFKSWKLWKLCKPMSSAGGYWLKKCFKIYPSVPLARLGHDPIRAIFLGASGFGKTNALRRILYQLLRFAERLLVIDGKGDPSSRADFGSLAIRAKRKLTIDEDRGLNIFAMPSEVGIAALSSFFPLRGGDGDEYQKRHIAAIRAVFTDKPIASIDELLRRLSHPSSDDHIKGRAYELLRAPAIGAAKRSTQGQETRRALEHYGHVLERLRNPGWTFDTPGMVYVRVPMPQNLDYGRLIMAAFSAYRTLGHKASRPRYNVVIDEAASLAMSDVAGDMAQSAEQVRSQNIGYIIATQSLQSLGEQGDRLVHAGVALYTANLSDPESALVVSGTKWQVESGVSRGMDREAKGDSVRVQHQYKVAPDLVRMLPRGVIYCSTPVPGDSKVGRVQQMIVVGPVSPATDEECEVINELSSQRSSRPEVESMPESYVQRPRRSGPLPTRRHGAWPYNGLNAQPGD